jgi:hypothetical protein
MGYRNLQWIIQYGKKSGEFHMVVDNHHLNKLTTQSQFPIPNVADIINDAWKNMMDLQSGYHKIHTYIQVKEFGQKLPL